MNGDDGKVAQLRDRTCHHNAVRRRGDRYPNDFTIVTKIGAHRGEDASWQPAFSAFETLAQGHFDVDQRGDHDRPD